MNGFLANPPRYEFYYRFKDLFFRNCCALARAWRQLSIAQLLSCIRNSVTILLCLGSSKTWRYIFMAIPNQKDIVVCEIYTWSFFHPRIFVVNHMALEKVWLFKNEPSNDCPPMINGLCCYWYHTCDFSKHKFTRKLLLLCSATMLQCQVVVCRIKEWWLKFSGNILDFATSEVKEDIKCSL